MRFLPVFLVLGTGAAAHPGHLAEWSGHDHWVAGAAIGTGVLIAVWGGLKGRTARSNDEAEGTRESEA